MTVTVDEKKEFLRWFLKKYQMKRRECVWILNYLISHESLLKNVHFVEESHYCPRAMIMSTIESSGIPFRFYKGSIMTADAEKSFHDLRLNTEEGLYISLNFRDSFKHKEYIAVLEENSYFPNVLNLSAEDKNLVESIIDNSIRNFQLKKIEDKIDIALDKKDKKEFLNLTELLKNN